MSTTSDPSKRLSKQGHGKKKRTKNQKSQKKIRAERLGYIKSLQKENDALKGDIAKLKIIIQKQARLYSSKIEEAVKDEKNRLNALITEYSQAIADIDRNRNRAPKTKPLKSSGETCPKCLGTGLHGQCTQCGGCGWV